MHGQLKTRLGIPQIHRRPLRNGTPHKMSRRSLHINRTLLARQLVSRSNLMIGRRLVSIQSCRLDGKSGERFSQLAIPESRHNPHRCKTLKTKYRRPASLQRSFRHSRCGLTVIAARPAACIVRTGLKGSGRGRSPPPSAAPCSQPQAWSGYPRRLPHPSAHLQRCRGSRKSP